ARPYRAHDPGRLWAGDRRPPDRSRGRLLLSGRTDLGHMASCGSLRLTSKPAPTLVRTGFQRGAKGTRTPDPPTASVVRYQLHHSPVKLCSSKLHHLREAFKTAGHGSSPPTSGPRARAGVGSEGGRISVSGASSQPIAPISRMAPLITKAAPNVRCWAISPTASDPTIAPKSAIIWYVATAVPPRALLPMMSAPAACCGEVNMPAPAPATNAPARNSVSEEARPTAIVATPETD